MLFIDSNIWCYYAHASAPEHPAVTTFLAGILGKDTIAVNTVVIMEVAHFLVKSLGSVAGRERMAHFLGFPFTLHTVDAAGVRIAIDLLCRHSHAGIGGRDATVLASMQALGITTLVTHDQAFRAVEGITVVDPCVPPGP